MSWFSDFLTDVSGPIGRSAQAGMINQENRNRDLAEQLQSFNQMMGPQLDFAKKRQAALLPGQMALQGQRDDASIRKALLLQQLKSVGKQANPQDMAREELAGYVANPGTEKLPWSPDFQSATPATPNYGIGEEATSGMAPTGMRERKAPYDPSKILGLGVRSGTNVEPLMKRLFPEQAVPGAAGVQRSTYDMDLGDKILVFDKATNNKVAEYPKVRPAGMGQGFENQAKFKFYQEGKELGLSDVDAAVYAQKRAMAEIVGPTATTRGAATALASNTGAPQAAKVDTAFKTGQASAQGGIQGNLAPVSSPAQPGQSPGPPIPGAQAVATAKELGGGIPAGEKKALSDLYSIRELSANIRKGSGNFTKPYWGPGHNVVAIGRERLAGKGGVPGLSTLSDEEMAMRRDVEDISDSLLRARSGAAITVKEEERLRRQLPSLSMPLETARARLDAFDRQLDIVIKNREAIQSGIQGTIGTPGGSTPHRVAPATTKVAPTTSAIPKLAPEGLAVVKGAPAGKTFTIGGKTYTREQLLGEQ